MKAARTYSKVFILSMDDFDEDLDSAMDEIFEPKSISNDLETIDKRHNRRRRRNALWRRFYKMSGNQDINDASA